MIAELEVRTGELDFGHVTRHTIPDFNRTTARFALGRFGNCLRTAFALRLAARKMTGEAL